MSEDGLLKLAKAARLFGVRSASLARWSRESRITAIYTPGAYRRYSRAQLTGILWERRPPLSRVPEHPADRRRARFWVRHPYDVTFNGTFVKESRRTLFRK